MRTGRSALRLAAGAILLCSSCGDEGSGRLRGSLLNFYDAEHERVRARLYSSELAIEYVREDGEVPVRVTLRRDADLVAGERFTLPARGALTGRVGDTDAPELEEGEVTLERFEIVEGERVVGEFTASFTLREDTASLSGTFDAPLQIVDRVPGYAYDFGVPEAEMESEGAGE